MRQRDRPRLRPTARDRHSFGAAARLRTTAVPIVGAEGVRDTYRKLNATSITFEVLEAFTAGPLVNRRVDRFVSARPFTWRGVGVFFVKDGKIKEWSDYTISMERG